MNLDEAISVTQGERSWAVVRGESLALLQRLPDACIDAVITDPPYSSGGQFRGDRAVAPSKKYVQTGTIIERPEFAGDNRDQRSFLLWCSLWLHECMRICKPGAPLVVFSDWRQLPTVTDAVQVAGFVWRGLGVWDKTEASRPRMGGFRSQSEYLVWATCGAMDEEVGRTVGVLPGVFRVPVSQDDKFHITGKPTALMRQVVDICRPGGVVLDPFAGSGTTLVAALMSDRKAIGFEVTEEYSSIASKRAGSVEQLTDWRRPEQVGLFGGGS